MTESIIYKQIEVARKVEKISYENLAKAINMSKGGLHASMKNKKLSLKSYLDICVVLKLGVHGVGIKEFVEASPSANFGIHDDVAETLDIISDALKKVSELRKIEKKM